MFPFEWSTLSLVVQCQLVHDEGKITESYLIIHNIYKQFNKTSIISVHPFIDNASLPYPLWFSKAKQVVKLLDTIGPGGTAPDPLVIKRVTQMLLFSCHILIPMFHRRPRRR